VEEKTEEQWRAESDARTMAEADAIKQDEERLAKAKEAASRMAEDAQQEAKDAAARAQSMQRLAGGGQPAPSQGQSQDKPKPAAHTGVRRPYSHLGGE